MELHEFAEGEILFHFSLFPFNFREGIQIIMLSTCPVSVLQYFS